MTRGPGASRSPPRPRTSQTRRRPPSLDPVRLRFFAGPEPADALRRFTEATGRQPKPEAPWLLGPWYQADDSEEAELARLREADAPLSVLQTYTHYLPCGDQVGREAAEAERIEGAHAAGVAITTYFNPMICTDYQPAYVAAAAAGALTEDAGGDPYLFRYGADVDQNFSVSPVRLLHRGRPGAVRQAARRGDRRRLRRLDGGLRRVHAARLGLRSRRRAAPGHLRAQPLRDPLPLRRLPADGRRRAADRPLPALRLDRRRSLRPGGLGRRPDDGLRLRRPALRGHPGALGGDLGNRDLGLRHRRVLRPRGANACRRSCSPAGSSWARSRR